jgi:hypothetical protein
VVDRGEGVVLLRYARQDSLVAHLQIPLTRGDLARVLEAFERYVEQGHGSHRRLVAAWLRVPV